MRCWKTHPVGINSISGNMMSFPLYPYLCSARSVKLTQYGFCFHQQEFFQYYTESGGSRPSADEENKMDLLRKGTNSAHRPAQIFRVQSPPPPPKKKKGGCFGWGGWEPDLVVWGGVGG